MLNKEIKIADNTYSELLKTDKGLHALATAHGAYRNNDGNSFLALYECHRYIISQQQHKQAKELAEKRRKELLKNIRPGELVFVRMGCTFEKETSDHVGEHRMRANFGNDIGKRYFIELSSSIKEDAFLVTFSIDNGLDKEYDRKTEKTILYNNKHITGEHKPWPEQNQYNAGGIAHRFFGPYTWTKIISLVNNTFGCSYTSARVIDYFIDEDDFVNKTS